MGTLKAATQFEEEMRVTNKAMFNVMKWSIDVLCRTADFPRSLVNIFQLISSPSPVCSYIPPTKNVSKLLMKMLDANIKSDSQFMIALQLELPFFHHLLADLQIESSLPEEWKGLLMHLDACSKNPFRTSRVNQVSTNKSEESKYSW